MNMDEDGPRRDSHKYWKMKVLSLHKDSSTKKKWMG